MNSDIKLGVTLFSFSGVYSQRRMDLEGILKTVHEMGYKGIELVAAQMVPEYPDPSDRWIGEFRNLLEKYSLELVTWSAYIDMGIRSDRDLSPAEIIQYTRNDMIYAKRAGASIVRTQHAITPEIFKRMIPFCKELDMNLSIEMHSPHHPDVPVWKEYLEIMASPDSEGYLGVVPDFSIFQHTPHEPAKKEFMEGGFDEEKLMRVIALHDAGKSEEEILSTESFTDFEKRSVHDIKHRFSAPAKVEDLGNLLPYAPYIHGKFHYLPANCVDPTIPFEKLIPIIKESGFKGYIASEYEGGDAEHTVEQLSRFVKMNTALLNS